jgi:hypothetical protein
MNRRTEMSSGSSEKPERKIPERLISLATVAQRLDRTPRTILRWRRRIGIPHYGFGRSSLFDWDEVVDRLRLARCLPGARRAVDCWKLRGVLEERR